MLRGGRLPPTPHHDGGPRIESESRDRCFNYIYKLRNYKIMHGMSRNPIDSGMEIYLNKSCKCFGSRQSLAPLRVYCFWFRSSLIVFTCPERTQHFMNYSVFFPLSFCVHTLKLTSRVAWELYLHFSSKVKQSNTNTCFPSIVFSEFIICRNYSRCRV